MPSAYAKVLEVEDGDTIKVEAQKDVKVLENDKTVTGQAVIRLPDVDTHETSTEQGKKEKKFVKDYLMKLQENAYYDYPFEVYSEGDSWDNGGYGRILASLRCPDDKELQVVIMEEFDNVLYEPKYGSDEKKEAQDN